MSSDYNIQDARPSSDPKDEIGVLSQVMESPDGDGLLGRVRLGLGFFTKAERYQQVERYRKGMYGDAAFGDVIPELAIQHTEYELGEEAWSRLSDDERESFQRGGEQADQVASEVVEHIDKHSDQLRQLQQDVVNVAEQRAEVYDEDAVMRAISAIEREVNDLRRSDDYLSRRECIELLGKKRLWTEFSGPERMAEVRRRAGIADWTPPHWLILMMVQDVSRSQDAELLRGITRRVTKREIEGESLASKKKTGLSLTRGDS